MHIGIIDHVGKKAGMDYYDSALMKALSKKGINTHIFSNFIGINPEKINYYQYYDGFDNSNKLLRLFRFIIATVKSSLKAKTININLLIIHLFSAHFLTFLLVLIPRLFNLKTAIILHDISSFRNNDKKIYQNLINNILTKYIIVHNQYSYNELVKLSVVRNEQKIRIIKHGGYTDFADQSNMTKTEAKDLLGLDILKKYILFFGQIKEVKGLDLLLQTLSHIDNNINLIIGGKSDSNSFNRYDKIIKKYQLSDRVIKIDNYIDHKEVIKLFKASEMIILPYKRIYQSGVLLMAMSFKLPVLASDLDPIKEIILDKTNGILFKNLDIDDLINTINKNVNNSKLLQKITKNAYQLIIKDYSWDNIANKYINLLI